MGRGWEQGARVESGLIISSTKSILGDEAPRPCTARLSVSTRIRIRNSISMSSRMSTGWTGGSRRSIGIDSSLYFVLVLIKYGYCTDTDTVLTLTMGVEASPGRVRDSDGAARSGASQRTPRGRHSDLLPCAAATRAEWQVASLNTPVAGRASVCIQE